MASAFQDIGAFNNSKYEKQFYLECKANYKLDQHRILDFAIIKVTNMVSPKK